MPTRPERESELARLVDWLREQDPARLERLRRAAERTTRRRLGAAVRLRALVEISSHCRRNCSYCGLRRANHAAARHRLSAAQILAAAAEAARWGIDTVVLQGGEDEGLEPEWLATVIGRIKRDTGRFVTLSLGERTDAELALWRRAGADRYLLRFETSDQTLYRRIHPPAPAGSAAALQSGDRLAILRRLRELGYEIGSGFMVGIPGQSDESVARDLLLLRELRLDMIGIGPFVPHPDTPLGRELEPSAGRRLASIPPRASSGRPMSASAESCARVVALARLLCPWANMPATTALATADPAAGATRGLAAGANVLMPDLTPPPLRHAYQIYPDKAGASESSHDCVRRAVAQSAALGLSVC